MNKDIMRQAGFGQAVTDVENGNCPTCQNTIDHADFRNEISRKEFGISGMCQKCQDSIFGED